MERTFIHERREETAGQKRGGKVGSFRKSEPSPFKAGSGTNAGKEPPKRRGWRGAITGSTRKGGAHLLSEGKGRKRTWESRKEGNKTYIPLRRTLDRHITVCRRRGMSGPAGKKERQNLSIMSLKKTHCTTRYKVANHNLGKKEKRKTTEKRGRVLFRCNLKKMRYPRTGRENGFVSCGMCQAPPREELCQKEKTEKRRLLFLEFAKKPDVPRNSPPGSRTRRERKRS